MLPSLAKIDYSHGILSHLHDISTHAKGVIGETGFTPEMNTGANELIADVATLEARYNTMKQYALEIQHGDNRHASAIEALSLIALNGDPGTGEGGVYHAYQAAQSMATLQLIPSQ